MVRHVVMWRLRDQAEGADRATNALRVKAALEGLRGRIPGLLRLEVGIDFNRSPAAWDVVLVSEHESRAALEAYQVHPEHVRAAEFIGKVRSDRAVIDHEGE
jgi:Stress responsive A/B Barrel Domain